MSDERDPKNPDEPIRVVFAPGALEQMEEALEPEELEEMMSVIEQFRKHIEAGGDPDDFVTANASVRMVSLEDLEDEDPEIAAQLAEQMASLPHLKPPTLN